MCPMPCMLPALSLHHPGRGMVCPSPGPQGWSLLFPGGFRLTVPHRLPVGSLSFLIAETQRGHGVPKAASESRRDTSEISGSFDRKRSLIFSFCGCFNFNQPSFPPFLLLLLLILFLLLLLEKSQNWELHPLIVGARSKPISTPTIPSPNLSPPG